jgi:hypothetical protein
MDGCVEATVQRFQDWCDHGCEALVDELAQQIGSDPNKQADTTDTRMIPDMRCAGVPVDDPEFWRRLCKLSRDRQMLRWKAHRGPHTLLLLVSTFSSICQETI